VGLLHFAAPVALSCVGHDRGTAPHKASRESAKLPRGARSFLETGGRQTAYRGLERDEPGSSHRDTTKHPTQFLARRGTPPPKHAERERPRSQMQLGVHVGQQPSATDPFPAHQEFQPATAGHASEGEK
jgi:hypothetical protein